MNRYKERHYQQRVQFRTFLRRLTIFAVWLACMFFGVLLASKLVGY